MSELNLSELEAQRAALDAQIAAAKAEAIAAAIAEVNTLMEAKGVTLEMLGGRKPRAPRTPKAPKEAKTGHPTRGSKVAPKFRNPETGDTWSGRGLKPNWLRAAIMQGRQVEEFAVTAEAS